MRNNGLRSGLTARCKSLFGKPSKPATNSAKTTFIASLLFLVLLISALWAALVLWVQLESYPAFQWGAAIVVAGMAMAVVVTVVRRLLHRGRWIIGYAVFWAAVTLWFAWLPAKQDRTWRPEVSELVSYTQDENNPDLLTLHNVRDFDWTRPEGLPPLQQPDQPYFYKVGSDDNHEVIATERWVNREVDLSKLSGIDIVNSYWMGEPIGHTLLSFRFENARPLTFSIEIRKEEGESFSTIGGFFRQFEMILIASEERDIIYTRSNVRGEQVYIFPIQGLTKAQIKDLFMTYMQQADELQQEPTWYNTLYRNCTTVLFEMAHEVSGEKLPWDYRILASGYVPDYLYDEGLLPNMTNEASKGQATQSVQSTNQLSRDDAIKQWYQRAHINPKTADFSFSDNQDPNRYSQLIRQNLPLPILAKPEE